MSQIKYDDGEVLWHSMSEFTWCVAESDTSNRPIDITAEQHATRTHMNAPLR